MTETDWLTCPNSIGMLDLLRGKASDRKLRLFAVGCCRHIWHRLPDDRSRNAVEVAERFADSLASERERATAEGDAFNLEYYLTEMDEFYHGSHYFRDGMLFAAVAAAADTLLRDAESSAVATARRTLEAMAADHDWDPNVQGRILRDVFRSPFHPLPAIASSLLTWNNGTIPLLAQSIYDNRAFDQILILADALEEAGCTDEDMLQHCHQQGEHVRGCWVIDLILGKK